MDTASSKDLPPEILEKYKKDYETVKEQERNLSIIINEILDETLSVSDGVIGVFGSFGYTFPDGKKGVDVIDYVANKIAEKNPGMLVITGKSHYFKDKNDGEVLKERNLQIALEELVFKDIITSMGHSRILASISNLVVFIISPSVRYTSQIEEAEFSSNKLGHNVLGVGIYIMTEPSQIEKVQCGCFEIEKIDHADNTYYFCKKIIKEEVKDCNGGFHPVGYATIEIFTKRVFTRLIATNNWTHIPDIFQVLVSKLTT